jgi:AraC-like DNA-binding protein
MTETAWTDERARTTLRRIFEAAVASAQPAAAIHRHLPPKPRGRCVVVGAGKASAAMAAALEAAWPDVDVSGVVVTRYGHAVPAGRIRIIERAMHLIDGGALDDRGVEDLAARLGIGPRHLDRLFQKHVGASPTQVAKTARVQRAKRLIDSTDLPMIEIALRSGFRSLRRFNGVFAEVYKRPPTEVRQSRRMSG